MAESDLKDDRGAPPTKRRKPDEPLPLETPISESAGFFNKPVDLSVLDSFSLEEDFNGNGGLSNGDLDLPSDSTCNESHGAECANDVISSSCDNLGKNGVTSLSNSPVMVGGAKMSRSISSPRSSPGIVSSKTFGSSLSIASNSIMHQMPVSTLGMPTPATPNLNTESNLTRSEQTPTCTGMLSSFSMSLPASFGYPVQSTLASSMVNRNNNGVGVSASNINANMNAINKMQVPLQNINLQSQNIRFANSNNMQILGAGPGAMRMQGSSGQMFNIHGNVNGQVLKLQNFRNDVARQIANQQQQNAMTGMNGPMGVQNVMSKFPHTNNQVAVQQNQPGALRQPMSFDNMNPAVSLNQAVNGPVGYTQTPGPVTSIPNQGMQQQIHVSVQGRGMLNPAQSDPGISMPGSKSPLLNEKIPTASPVGSRSPTPKPSIKTESLTPPSTPNSAASTVTSSASAKGILVKKESVKTESCTSSSPQSDKKFPFKKIFSKEELLDSLLPVFEKVFELEPESLPFRLPVDPMALGIPDYFTIVKCPMDLSLIRSKLDAGKYEHPWEFCDDMRLMFDNDWLYSRKTSRVYKYCSKLAEIFEAEIDPVMKSLGYCCGRKHVFSPQVLYCHGKHLCQIPRDAAYYSYQSKMNSSQSKIQSKYHYCERCFSEFEGDAVNIGDESGLMQSVPPTLHFSALWDIYYG